MVQFIKQKKIKKVSRYLSKSYDDIIYHNFDYFIFISPIPMYHVVICLCSVCSLQKSRSWMQSVVSWIKIPECTFLFLIFLRGFSCTLVSSPAASVMWWEDGMMGYVVTHPSPRILSSGGPSIRLWWAVNQTDTKSDVKSQCGGGGKKDEGVRVGVSAQFSRARHFQIWRLTKQVQHYDVK